MAKLRLTDDHIRTRPRPDKGNVIDYDSEAKGLAVRFTPTGIPTFLFCYGSSVAGGSARRMAIGRWNDASGKRSASVLPKIRARAAELALEVMAKRDPYAERVADAERDAAQRESERQERERVAAEAEAAREREASELTVDELFARYLDKHGSTLRLDSCRRAKRRMKRYISPAWGERKAKDITRADVIALLKPLRADGKKSEFVHLLSLVNGLFAFAVDDDALDTITLNPAFGLKKKLVSKADRPKAKDRALTTEREFRTFYLMTQPGKHMPADAADCLRLMMLTGCRPSEAAGLEWDEIDFHGKLWNKPEDVEGRSKSRRADVVPLLDEAMAILSARRGNGSGYVFPSGRNRRKENGGGEGMLTVNRLDAAMRRVAPRLARLGVAKWTPHDLRSTVTTGLFDLGVSEYLVKRTLNHATTGVTDTHYNKSTFLPQRREALEKWTRKLRELMGEKPRADNVIEFRTAAGGH